MFMITFILVVLMTVMFAIKPNGVPLGDIAFGNVSLPFYMAGTLTILVTAGLFCVYCTYRIIIRKKKSISSRVAYFIRSPKCDIYWIYIFATYFFFIVFSLVAYWAKKQKHYLTIGILAPLSLIFYLNAYIHYMMNDYNILQDIKSLNIRIQKRNLKIEKL